jgi:hypothetical protein
MSQLFIDAKKRPELFHWNGKVEPARLQIMLENEGWNIPQDLFEVWCHTGGGDIFESEEILCPANQLCQMKEEASSLHQALPGAIVFHSGLFISVVQQSTSDYLVLERESRSVIATFPSFEAWYLGTLRAEYAERYGLA